MLSLSVQEIRLLWSCRLFELSESHVNEFSIMRVWLVARLVNEAMS